ncbi:MULTISPECIES: prepilin peptidase [Auritidibacter]|uniref:prepilin peptidase n=1 Tax=Auritidibacter TaxID=1160973 RepID=UPI000D72BD29|nr:MULTISPECIES: A24 family peptidase [Auritidibacter]PXA75082.1 peptidase [Auritidibacter sp. NML120779]AXR73992.1 prepilin peptidase [Auritidibacter sp. NML130574]NIH71777.1 leader peptidase (prepilin peptidase)/N-methyltransferase [Auritidibacter ignavus]PXA75967.1 peptidase [Auritidibacter sp. NML100628]PXA80157.1 peptidase [Auritidibacter sp. NML120636]
MLATVFSLLSEMTFSAHTPGFVWLCCVIAMLIYVVSCIVLFTVDVRQHRLPNGWTATLAIGAVAFLGVSTLIAPQDSVAHGRLATMVVGLFGYPAVMFVLHLITRGGLGMGDVKLAAGLGAYTGFVGWEATVVALVLGFVLGGLISLVAVVFTSATWASRIPFGPAMILAATFALLG